ncbi:TrmB family transcriptional regulator [Vibrio vulnificus]|uniref:TrmB family transcriptional regulator n=1 Tax=Vibrio TaxID=662 RepID=UPI0006AD2989|nr:TrmB family transcriptional regulator [Vibrio vulnificus]MCF8777394.1 TrmB family transcriptional regulator [Vibrio floridensis]ALM72487.1 CymJ protein [Vibrio vulnificus]ANH64849.1 TrmB family transcriptional regulator [Vibrio vulnificus]KOR99851.1 TrmB family transcriptional regulator [Vibrio vulnificus]MBN8101779.1 TrmB family transcriptional regulator [Vibrio vulnificus]
MTELVTKLMDFGFTKTDALVYINLLKNGRASGYKIAKEIGLSRSSVYSSIDNLYKNGCIFMSDGETKEYEAKSPDLIFNQIEKKTIENIQILKKELSRMMLQEEKEFIYNVTGFENLLQKAREMLNLAQVEIYLNTDFHLELLSEEISQAIERGVRVIVFSFNRLAIPHPKVELYSRSEQSEKRYPSHRFMLVVDMKQAMMFSHRQETQGLYSNNRLIVKMMAEHIHSDIYLTEYEKLDPEKRCRIATIHELENDMVVDDRQQVHTPS